MTSVNYGLLKTFHDLYQTESASLDIAQKLIIDHLNKTVKKDEEAQPQPFSAKYINKIGLSLTQQATADEAESIISAIEIWKAQWFKQQEPAPMNFQASANADSVKPKMMPNLKAGSSFSSPTLSFTAFQREDSYRPLKMHARASVEESKESAELQTHTRKGLLAALTMNYEDFTRLVRANEDVEDSYVSWEGENGENILHLAAEVCSEDTLEFLSGLGTHRGSDKHKRNLLHYAAERDNIGAIDYFCRVGEQHLLSEVDSNGYTPLHTTILKQSSECLIAMLSYGWQQLQSIQLPSGDNELHLAAQNGFLAAFSQGLLHSQFKYTLDNKNKLGQTPLQIAAKEGHLGIVRLICAFGTDSLSKKNKEAAIELARVHNHPLICEFLTTGTIANAPTYEDLKADPESLVELINHGLDINGLQNGKSMLHRAIEDDSLPLVIHMINNGGALITVEAASEHSYQDVGPNKGLPALYLAASLGRANIARYLNETFYGRNNFLRVQYGHSGNPIHLARRLGKGSQISGVLLNRGWN